MKENTIFSESTPESEWNDKQRELYQNMSDISEECYCAGWMMGLEFAIWGALHDGDRSYGMGEMDSSKLERCRALAQELGGWIVWFDDDILGLPIDLWGPRFVPMTLWMLLHSFSCTYCGGNDELPQDHCADCSRPRNEPEDEK